MINISDRPLGASLADFTDDSWLLIVEDEGPHGLGRVLGYFVFATQALAERQTRGAACDALDLFRGEEIPNDVQMEVMTYSDFKASYGNRMPLKNRGA